jgi:hypothetical protein
MDNDDIYGKKNLFGHTYSYYDLTMGNKETFESLWKEHIQFFEEVPHGKARVRIEKAKRFASKVYALAITK